MMPRPLYRYCLWLHYSPGYYKFTVAHLLFSLLCNIFHAKSKSKPDNSKPKSPPPLTVYYANIRWGNFTDLEAFVPKKNPFETNLHNDIQDSDFQSTDYLPIHRKDAGHVHGLSVYVKSNLLE